MGDEAIPSNGDHNESSDHQIDGNDHEEEEIVLPVRQRRPKKKLTGNRLVKSIDTVLRLR